MGSATWMGAEAYEEGHALHKRATTFVTEVRWDKVTSLCSNLRNVPCDIGRNFSVGHFNLVRQIIFNDGIIWVVRLRLPDLPAVFGHRETLDAVSTLATEVATMKYLRANTRIPVPSIYHYNTNPANDFGAPYIIMEYVDGNVASELRETKGCALGLFGTVEQDRRFRQQMANIQVQLASCQFDQIGAIHEGMEDGKFVIGREIDTGRGPWSSASAYYADLVKHVLNACVQDARPAISGFSLPIVFEYLIGIYGDSHNNHGPFSLTNRDYGARNIIVNDEFEILAVIDFDGVIAAPVEIVAQYPLDAFMNVPPLGYVSPKPAVIQRVKFEKPKLNEYKQLLKDAEKRLYGDKAEHLGFADSLLSTPASIYQGIMDYQLHSGSRNMVWMEIYSELLTRSLDMRRPST